jgi:branched-chain amino acid transport system permease protein
MEKMKSTNLPPFGEKGLSWYWLVAGLAILFLLPVLLPRFWTCLLTEIFILGLAGMSVNFLLGYGGSLPFGHAAFYATGAYATAILIKKTGIPQVVVLLIAPLIAMLAGAIFGLLIARLYRFYYAMMTTAFSMVLWTLIRKWPSLTGGDTGMTGVEIMAIPGGINNTYYFTVIVVLFSLLILWFIINSPFGWALRAIRENSNRSAFTGIDVIKHRYVAFVVSSFFCGIAGTLFVVYSHSTFPDYAYWVKSGDLVMVCILGGMFSFLGPIIGAAILTILQTVVISYTTYWPLVIGTIICVVVLVMPDGVMGVLQRLRPYARGKMPHQLDAVKRI